MPVSSLAQRSHKMTLDPLGFVRRSTHSRHAAIEHGTPLARLADRGCTLDDYRAALGPLVRIYRAVDKQLLAAECWRPQDVAMYRLRAPLLTAELRRWGQAGGASASSGRTLDSAAAYLGVRYVIDGAHFGHRVIAASLARSPAAAVVGHEPSFWSTPFVSTAEWRLLCNAVAGLRTRSEVAHAARAARFTFELFSQELHTRTRKAA